MSRCLLAYFLGSMVWLDTLSLQWQTDFETRGKNAGVSVSEVVANGTNGVKLELKTL